MLTVHDTIAWLDGSVTSWFTSKFLTRSTTLTDATHQSSSDTQRSRWRKVSSPRRSCPFTTLLFRGSREQVLHNSIKSLALALGLAISSLDWRRVRWVLVGWYGPTTRVTVRIYSLSRRWQYSWTMKITYKLGYLPREHWRNTGSLMEGGSNWQSWYQVNTWNVAIPDLVPIYPQRGRYWHDTTLPRHKLLLFVNNPLDTLHNMTQNRVH